MRVRIPTGLLSAAFLSLLPLLFSACTHKDESKVIKMGFTPAESTEKVESNGKVLANILEKKTGYKFQIYVASDYTALIEAMRSNQVQIGWLAPFAFVLAEKNANAHVLLKSVRHGKAAQYSAIIVKDSSPIKTVARFKRQNHRLDRSFSSSGHVLPKSALINMGITPDSFFRKQTWGGSHESVVMAVMNNGVDAGATYCDDDTGKTGSWTRFEKNLGAKAVHLRSVFVTPPMPSDTVSVSGKFLEKSPEVTEKIKVAIQSLSETPEGREALQNIYGIDGLVDAKSEDYEPLRKAAAVLGYSLANKKN